MNKQQGFTLIELIMVIVILGILAATALPKFVDLSGDAKQAKADGVAGAIASAASIRYAASQISGQGSYSSTVACSGTYLQGGMPTGCTTDSANPCTVTCDTKSAAAITLP